MNYNILLYISLLDFKCCNPVLPLYLIEVSALYLCNNTSITFSCLYQHALIKAQYPSSVL